MKRLMRKVWCSWRGHSPREQGRHYFCRWCGLYVDNLGQPCDSKHGYYCHDWPRSY